MASTGELQARRWELVAFMLGVLGIVAATFMAYGGLVSADPLPPCSQGNHLEGTCRIDQGGSH